MVVRILIVNPNSNPQMTEGLREVVGSLGYENVRVSLVGLGKCLFGFKKQTEYGYFTAPAEAPFSINGLEDGSTSGQVRFCSPFFSNNCLATIHPLLDLALWGRP